MLIDEHKQLANKIVDLSKKSGADTAVVRIDYNKNNQISVREQKIESLEQAGSKSLSLTLSKDKKRVSVSSNDFSESAIKSLIKDAMAMVKYMGVDEFYDLPDQSELGKASEELLLFDPKESDFPMERRIEMAKSLESNALKENKDLISDGASVGSTSGHTVLANSKGFCDGYQYTDCFIDMNCAVPDSIDGLNSAKAVGRMVQRWPVF